MANINLHNVSEEEHKLYLAFTDLISFGKLFLWGDFQKSVTPDFHHDIGKELLSDSNKPCAIIVPRGHGKTTLIKAKILHDLCFAKQAAQWGLTNEEKDLFFGWCSSSQKKSRNNVAYIKLHLEYNERMIYYFGNLRGNTWNQEDLITRNGDRLVSSSNLTSMRGDTQATIKSGALRYSNVFIDDAENEENTKSQNSRDSIVNNIMDGILPAVEKNIPGSRMFLTETPVHFAAFAQQILDKYYSLKDDPEKLKEYTWKVLTWKATQPDGTILWPDYYPQERLEQIKQTYIDSPKGVSGYYQEYELEVQSTEVSIWTRKHFQYHSGTYIYDNGHSWLLIDNEKVPINTFIGCDPATDIDSRNSDFSVIMVVAIDNHNQAYILEYERHRAIPTIGLKSSNNEIIGKHGVVDYIFNLWDKYHVKSSTVEDVAMNRSVFQALYAECNRRNRYDVSAIPEKPGGREKRNRIYSGLSSRFSDGSIYLRENMFDLEREIITFGPKMAHDDTIETLFLTLKNAYPPDFAPEKGKNTLEFYEKRVTEPKDWKVL